MTRQDAQSSKTIVAGVVTDPFLPNPFCSELWLCIQGVTWDVEYLVMYCLTPGLRTLTCRHYFCKEFHGEVGCTHLPVSYGYTNGGTLLVRDDYHSYKVIVGGADTTAELMLLGMPDFGVILGMVKDGIPWTTSILYDLMIIWVLGGILLSLNDVVFLNLKECSCHLCACNSYSMEKGN